MHTRTHTGVIIFTMAGEVYNTHTHTQHTHNTHTHTKDATDVFAAFHAGATTQYLKEFEIGEVDYYGTKDKELVFIFFGIFLVFLFIHLRNTQAFEIGEVDYYGTKNKELVFFYFIFIYLRNNNNNNSNK
jgi:hypothetical protein